jgi:agmatinase
VTIARIDPVPGGRPTFLNVPRCEELDSLDGDIAIIAVPYNTPYDLAYSRAPSSLAPSAVREQSLRWADRLHHYDFDFGADLFAGRAVRIVDCGDVWQLPGRYEENSRMATAVIKKILERGVLPIILGGDHATTIPVMRAYEAAARSASSTSTPTSTGGTRSTGCTMASAARCGGPRSCPG